VSIEYLLQTCN